MVKSNKEDVLLFAAVKKGKPLGFSVNEIYVLFVV